MDGRVDVTTSGVPQAARVTPTRAAEGAARTEPGAGTPAPARRSPTPSFRPSPEETPPNWVFAPGFLHADRRGLVPYPGVDLPDGMLSSVLLRKYLEQAPDRTHEARQAYEGGEQLTR